MRDDNTNLFSLIGSNDVWRYEWFHDEMTDPFTSDFIFCSKTKLEMNHWNFPNYLFFETNCFRWNTPMTCMRAHFTIVKKNVLVAHTHPNDITIEKQFNACKKEMLWVTIHWGRKKSKFYKTEFNYTWHQRDLTAPQKSF